jgi:putative transcriptional regulator
MAINYDKLFHMMIDRKITNIQLKDMAGVSANIITRLKRDEYFSIESIEKICKALQCGVDDILEFVKKEEQHENQ